MKRKPTILVVDDTAESLALLISLLEGQGYRVRTVAAGDLALASIKIKQPDLVLLDIRIDGIEVCRQLKARKETRNIPIILISAFVETEERIVGLRLGAVDYITKPFHNEELLAKIKTHIALNLANALLLKQSGVLRKSLTQTKQTEELLRQNESLLRIAGRMGKIGGWSVNLVKEKVHWSDEVAAIHEVPIGYSPTLTDAINFYAPEWRSLLTEVFDACAQNGVPFDEEMEVITAAGNRIWVRTSGEAVHDKLGHIIQVQGAFQDITTRKTNEEKIRKLNVDLERRVLERTAQLEVSNKELEAFSYSVAHDLRAPLRSIDGFARILSEEYGTVLDAEGLRLLGIIKTSANDLNDLITDMLSLAQVSKSKLKLLSLDMRAMAIKCFNKCADPAILEDFELIVGDLPEVEADKTLLNRVWVNLLSNAVKYSVPSPIHRIEISGESINGMSSYTVRDHGAGFDSRYAGKLFVMFQRLHNPEEFSGTGVGLAITKKIIDRHGGEIRAKSSLGKGAAFTFCIPSRGEK